ncbi:MAG: hypothetical protein M3020_02020 [Myxococcota bacterium]|jgi:hypothetical protein|nr:hypothetical protein [Myxococcota bacterium]
MPRAQASGTMIKLTSLLTGLLLLAVTAPALASALDNPSCGGDDKKGEEEKKKEKNPA